MNTGKAYRVVNRKPPYLPVQVTTTATELGYGMIVDKQKLRAQDDCVRRRVWAWTRRPFVLANAGEPTLCRIIAPGGGSQLWSYFAQILLPH